MSEKRKIELSEGQQAIVVSFYTTEFGTAGAEVSLVGSDRGEVAVNYVVASGKNAYGILHGGSRQKQYKDHTRAISAALRDLAERIAVDWTMYAQDRAPGAW